MPPSESDFCLAKEVKRKTSASKKKQKAARRRSSNQQTSSIDDEEDIEENDVADRFARMDPFSPVTDETLAMAAAESAVTISFSS